MFLYCCENNLLLTNFLRPICIEGHEPYRSQLLYGRISTFQAKTYGLKARLIKVACTSFIDFPHMESVGSMVA